MSKNAKLEIFVIAVFLLVWFLSSSDSTPSNETKITNIIGFICVAIYVLIRILSKK